MKVMGKNKKMLIGTLFAVCFLTGCQNYVQDGTELLSQGKYEEAAAAFQSAVSEAQEKQEDSAEGYRGLGMAYYEMQNYDEARSNLEAALDKGAEETPAIYNLIGICAMNQQDYDGALKAFEKGIALPESAVISEGTELEQTADYAEVIQEMKFNRVVCFEKKLDWANAKTAMAEYTAAYPDDTEAAREAQFLETR